MEKTQQRKRQYVNKMILCLGLAAAALVTYCLDQGCWFRNTFGIICPGCGFSRGLACLFRLDFAKAFYYHPMVYALPLLLLFVIKDGKLFRNKKLNYGVLLLLAIGLVVCYVVRLFNHDL